MGRINDKSVKISLIKFHLLRTFFEDLDKWRAERRIAGITGDLSQTEYDNLFRGTCADMYVPLWASCLSGMDILLNEETLSVIKFYKKYGYRHVNIDGNPADYIGEQFRFLEYLYACVLKAESSREKEELLDASLKFIDDYTLDTFREMAANVRKYSGNRELMSVLRFGEETLSCSKQHIISENYEEIDKIIDSFDSADWTKGEELPVEEKRIVSSASFSDCGMKCKMLTTVQEGCILRINPDTDCGFSGCPRGAAYRQSYLNSRRLRYPMERTGERGEGKFRRISWQEAEEKLYEIVKESHNYGPTSRYVMAGAGVTNGLQCRELLKNLLALDGGLLSYYSTYSVGAAIPTLTKMFGTLLAFNNEEEIRNADLLVLWGSNILSTHFGLRQKKLLMEAKESGTEIIVIDPRQSDTVVCTEGEWIPLRPGTDAALASAVCYTLVQENLYDKSFVDKYCLGFDGEHLPDGVPKDESYIAYLNGEKDGVKKTPAWASVITGIPEDVIYNLAMKIGKTDKVIIMPGLGMQRTLNGEQNYRSILTIPCLLGNLGKKGAGLVSWIRPEEPKPQMRGYDNPCKAQIPVFNWWRAVECPETLNETNGLVGTEKLDEPVRYIFSIASGMLQSQHSNLNHTLELLKSESVRAIVLSDIFMTPSVKAADLVLPAPSFFETDNFNLPWISDDYFLFNNHAVEPLFEARLELEWLNDLAERLGLKEKFADGKESLDDWLREMWDDYVEKIRTANREGSGDGKPSGTENNQSNGGNAITNTINREADANVIYQSSVESCSFEKFKEKAYVNCKYTGDHVTLAGNINEGLQFDTPSGKIEIFIKEVYDRKLSEAPGVPTYVPIEEGHEDSNRDKYPLQLIGYKANRRSHSMYDYTPWLAELEPHRLWINTNDAKRRGIGNGDTVFVYNYRGKVKIEAFVTDRIMEGVCAMGDSAWIRRDEKGIDEGGAINSLTMDHRSLPIGHGNPQHTNLVEVSSASSTENHCTAILSIPT